MNFLKKWMGCIVSFVAGTCGLALSACSGMVTKVVTNSEQLRQGLKAMGLEEGSTQGFKVLTDGKLYDKAKGLGIGSEFMVMKVFAIITLIASILLIAYAIVALLKNLNVIKFESKIFDIVGFGLIVLLLVATIGLFVSSNAFAGAQADKLNAILTSIGYNTLATIKVSVGVYQIAMLVISIITVLAVATFTFLKRKSA